MNDLERIERVGFELRYVRPNWVSPAH